MAYVRTVKTSSGATAAQIVRSWRRGFPRIEHVGSTYAEEQPAALKAAARQTGSCPRITQTAGASRLRHSKRWTLFLVDPSVAFRLTDLLVWGITRRRMADRC